MPHLVLPYFLISAFVALLDILPMLIGRRPWRCSLALYVQVAATGLVVFMTDLTALPWWLGGPVAALVLALPQLLQPAPRGAYAWYVALPNFLAVGFAFAAIRHYLPDVARFFS